MTSVTIGVVLFIAALLFASIKVQLRKIRSPHGIFTPRFDGRQVPEDVLNSVMAFFAALLMFLGVVVSSETMPRTFMASSILLSYS